MTRPRAALFARGFLALACFSLAPTACATTTDKDPRMSSSHFKDGVFRNTHSLPAKSLWTALKMRLTTDWAKWPDWVDIKPGPKPAERVEGDEVKVTFINHATFLVQTRGYNILTDPIYSKRCSPVSFVGPARVHQPGIAFDELPKIDVVLISHDHYDHLDTPTLKKLIARDNPKIIVGLGVGERFDTKDNVIELDWWHSTEIADNLKITFTEVQHFSGRFLTDRNTTLWGAFVVEAGDTSIYFGGDSGYADHYTRTAERFPVIDIALLPIGAYSPRSFMGPVHMDPKQAVQAHQDLGAKKSIGMHFGTFQLTAETRDEPEKLLESEKKAAGLADDAFVTLAPGGSLVVR